MIRIQVPSCRVRLRPRGSAVQAAAMAPKTAPTSYNAVMVPIMRVLGVPICESQYFEMTTPDITPWS